MSKKNLNAVYMTMMRTDKGADMHKVSPFLIKRSIDKEIGPVQECKKLRNGILLIKCSLEQAEKLMHLKSLNKEVNVKCEKHESFNTAKGKIFSRDFCYLSDEEILTELADQKVSDVKRIKRRDKVTRKPTDEDIGIYVLTFKVCTIPEYIQIGYNKVSVDEFIPDPFRCFKCFRFGHSAEKCRETTKKCPNCGCDAHSPKDPETGIFEKCEKSANCVNCHKNHNSLYRKCETFKKEKEIQCIRIKNRVSYFEARRRYKIQHPLQFTFASVVKTPNNPKINENIIDDNTGEPTAQKEELCSNDMEQGMSDMEVEEVVIANTKTVTTKDGKEITIYPRNTPKHKLDKVKAEQKKKAKFESKCNTSPDESSE